MIRQNKLNNLQKQNKLLIPISCYVITKLGKNFNSKTFTMQTPRITLAAHTLLALGLAIALIYFAAPFLIPLVLAALLAMLFKRFSYVVEKRGVPRGLSALLSVLIFVSAIVLLGLLVAWQLGSMSDNFEEMKDSLFSQVERLREWLSTTAGVDYTRQEEIVQSQQQSSGESGNVFMQFFWWLQGFLVDTVLLLVYMFLLLYYRAHLKKILLMIVSDAHRENARTIVNKSADVSGKYLIGLCYMILILWVMYGVGFSIIGLEGAILFAIICGMLEIIPFVGNLIGSIVAFFAALAQGGDERLLIGVVATYLIVQLIQTYLLEPLVVGQKVSINPLFIVTGLVVGEMVWGVGGMIVAIPLLGITKIICDHIPSLRPYGLLLGPVEQKKQERDTPPKR